MPEEVRKTTIGGVSCGTLYFSLETSSKLKFLHEQADIILIISRIWNRLKSVSVKFLRQNTETMKFPVSGRFGEWRGRCRHCWYFSSFFLSLFSFLLREMVCSMCSMSIVIPANGCVELGRKVTSALHLIFTVKSRIVTRLAELKRCTDMH